MAPTTNMHSHRFHPESIVISGITIPLFNGTNYNDWNHQVMLVILYHGLLDCLSKPNYPKLYGSVDEDYRWNSDKYDRMKIMEQKTLAIILASLDNTRLQKDLGWKKDVNRWIGVGPAMLWKELRQERWRADDKKMF